MAELDLDRIRSYHAAGPVMRVDVTALIAEVERLRHEVFVLTNSEDARVLFVEQERDEARRDAVRALAERDIARTELQRLRDQIVASQGCQARGNGTTCGMLAGHTGAHHFDITEYGGAPRWT